MPNPCCQDPGPTNHANANPTLAASPRPATTGDDPAVARSAALSHAAETRRLYAADWAAFARWCRDRRLATLPAEPATVAAYLRSLSALSHGALARRATAIAGQHRQADHPSPSHDPDVQSVLRTARADQRAKSKAVAPGGLFCEASARRRPLSAAQLVRMAARCAGDLGGLRDRALLLLAAAGLGAERLLALDREHVRQTGPGMELDVRGSDGTGLEPLVLTRGAAWAVCPVHALERWLDSSDTRFGPVFRKVNRWGAVEHGRLRPDGLRRIWRRRAQAVSKASETASPSARGAIRLKRVAPGLARDAATSQEPSAPSRDPPG